MTATALFLVNPYPGLRPFRASESYLFFGRGAQTDQLLAQLRRSRFVAVMGASGSGKSSLVAAGLVPALHGGFSTPMGSRWRITNFRPGGNPIHNLARALTASDVLGQEDIDPSAAVARREATLRRSGLGLGDVAKHAQDLGDDRLLVIVDQFEELFRFRGAATDGDGAGEGAAFVQLLIGATRDEDSPVDVIVTMRSDYLGDCSQFQQLPEAINDGLYLVPRLTRTQLREAITGPAAVAGAEIAPRLVQRLLNDAGTDPDVLPVVQHALMRTWDLWAEDGMRKRPIDIEHYEAGGGLEEALARHADEACYELSDERSREIAELTFKRLTELGEDGREGRRPSRLDEIAAVTGANVEEVREVIGHFEQHGRSFITVSEDDVVDISHESLIRQWPRLRRWVREEAGSRDVYLRLANSADLWGLGEAALLRDPDLQVATTWWDDTQPNDAWAERYNPAFEQAAEYLERSQVAANRRRLLGVGGVVALGAVAVVLAVLAVWAIRAEGEAERQRRIAVGGELAAVSLDQGPALRVQSTLTALEALRSTEIDGLRLPEAEEALRTALADPLGTRLPGRVGQLGHEENITALAFSPDGTRMATGSEDDTTLLWNLTNLDTDPVPLRGHQGDVTALAFSPDGRWLATGSADDTAMLWDLNATEADPMPLDGHQDDVTALAFSPDGRWLATGSLDGTTKLWDRENLDAGPQALEPGVGFVHALGFSPDGRLLATGHGTGSVVLWDLAEPEADPMRLPDHEFAVVTVAFSPGGELLATGSRDRSARIWDLVDSSADPIVLHHGAAVLTLAFSPDQRFLATGAEDNTARLWDLAGAPDLVTVLPHSGPVSQVAFSPGGRWLATGGTTDPARLFRLDDVAAGPTPLAGPVTALRFSPDEQWLAIGTDEGSARLWDLGDLSTRPIVLGHDEAVGALAFSPDSQTLATGTADNAAHVWSVDMPDAEPIPLPVEDIEGLGEAEVETMAYSPDGNRLATGSGDRRIRVWDLLSPQGEPQFREMGAGVNALAFDPIGRWLAVAVEDAEALLLDADDLTDVRILPGHGDDVTAVAFSADGSRLATGSRDGDVLIWDLEDLAADPQTLQRHEDRVTSLAFSPDGSRLATGSWDRTVLLWELDAGRPAVLYEFDADDPVNSVAYRSDGGLVAVATRKANVQLWDLTASHPDEPVANPVVLTNHSQAVNAVAFSPDGRWLATGSDDRTVRLWLQLDELMRLGCESAGRNLTADEWLDIRPGQPYSRTCEQWPGAEDSGS